MSAVWLDLQDDPKVTPYSKITIIYFWSVISLINEYEKKLYCMDFYLKLNYNSKFNVHRLLFKIQYGHHHSPPSSQVNHEPHQLPGNWAFSHSRTTIAKCRGAPYCMKIKSLILFQAMIIGQTSSFSIARYLSAFMESWRMKRPTILSKVIPHHTIRFCIFYWKHEDLISPSSGRSDGLQTHLCGIQLQHTREFFFKEIWPIFIPSQHHLSKLHTNVAVFGRKCLTVVGLPNTTFKLIFEQITYTA